MERKTPGVSRVEDPDAEKFWAAWHQLTPDEQSFLKEQWWLRQRWCDKKITDFEEQKRISEGICSRYGIIPKIGTVLNTAWKLGEPEHSSKQYGDGIIQRWWNNVANKSY